MKGYIHIASGRVAFLGLLATFLFAISGGGFNATLLTVTVVAIIIWAIS